MEVSLKMKKLFKALPSFLAAVWSALILFAVSLLLVLAAVALSKVLRMVIAV